MTHLNPVSAFVRDYVAEHYARWHSRAEEPIPTRAGERYLSSDVATLLAPALVACNLRVFEDYFARLFVTAKEGRQITRARLGELLDEALADHPDRVLRASVGSVTFWEHVVDRTPAYDGEEIERTPRETSAATSSTFRPFQVNDVCDALASLPGTSNANVNRPLRDFTCSCSGS